MKKVFSFVAAVAILLMLCGCQTETVGVNLAQMTAEIGKTAEDLQRQNPSYVCLCLDGCDCCLKSLGRPDGSFAYVFFGVQDERGVEDAVSRYAKQLKCAGVYTTVETAFSIPQGGPVSVEDFLSSIGVDGDDPDQVEYWAGWIRFDYKGYSVEIHTGEVGDDICAKPTVKIEGRFPVVLSDQTVMSSNAAFLSQRAEKG